MRKIFIVLASLCLFGVQNSFASCAIDKIYDKYQIVYLPSSNAFTTGAMIEDRIILKKESSSGTGSYSSYYYSDGKIAFKLPTNFEFIKDSRLIACDNANLKYLEVYYKNGKFYAKELSFKEIKHLFPTVKVVKVSKFKNGILKVRKIKDYILLFNDTNSDFYRYSTTPTEVGSTDIKGLIDISKINNITFSHYNENNQTYPKYEIIVK